MPNYVISQGTNKVILRNFEGVITTYTEPKDYSSNCQCEICNGERPFKYTGVSGLHEGLSISIEPKDLLRRKRNGK